MLVMTLAIQFPLKVKNLGLKPAGYRQGFLDSCEVKPLTKPDPMQDHAS